MRVQLLAAFVFGLCLAAAGCSSLDGGPCHEDRDCKSNSCLAGTCAYSVCKCEGGRCPKGQYATSSDCPIDWSCLGNTDSDYFFFTISADGRGTCRLPCNAPFPGGCPTGYGCYPSRKQCVIVPGGHFDAGSSYDGTVNQPLTLHAAVADKYQTPNWSFTRDGQSVSGVHRAGGTDSDPVYTFPAAGEYIAWVTAQTMPTDSSQKSESHAASALVHIH